MRIKETTFDLSDQEHEDLKKAISEKGIIFEEEVESFLNQFFNANSWNVLSNVCFREKVLDEEFNGRFEIDFIVRRSQPLSTKEIGITYGGVDLDFLNPHFLIEAKSSQFNWCFFDLNKSGEKKRSDISFFVENEDEEKAYFSPKEIEVLKLKREISVGTKKNFKISPKDLIRDSVRQLIKNMQIYMRKDLEKIYLGKMLIPIIVTNAPLIVFHSLFDNKKELNLRTHKEHPYLCFEFDEFLFWKGENVKTKVHDKNNALSYKNFSKIHIWIVNQYYLPDLIKKLIPARIQQPNT